MAVGVGQGSAYGAATCAGLAFIMLIFACASPWTLWGGACPSPLLCAPRREN